MIRPIMKKTTNTLFSGVRGLCLYPLHDGASLGFEPFSGSIVIGTMLCNQRPKAGGMVHLAAVAQLVDHHIVPHPLGAKHEKAVEIQISLA